MRSPTPAEIGMRTVAELSGGAVTWALDRPLKRLMNRSGDRFMAINPWFRYRKVAVLRHFEHVADVHIAAPLFVGVAHEGLLTEGFPADVVVKRNVGYRCKGVWVFPNRHEQNDVLHDRSWTSLLEELIPEQDTIVIERKLPSNFPLDPGRTRKSCKWISPIGTGS